MLGHLQGLKPTLLSALHSPNYKPSSTRKLDRFKSIFLIYIMAGQLHLFECTIDYEKHQLIICLAYTNFGQHIQN